MKNLFCVFIYFCIGTLAHAQNDSTAIVGNKIITLSEVVAGQHLDVPHFIYVIKNDSSFYKAFRNLHILNFTARNDIRMLDKKGGLEASLQSETRQLYEKGCRHMKVLQEKITGNIYDANHEFNYYTAKMYASLFFTKDTVCGENNIVAGREFSTSDKSGMEKHKEQLKMLFFNPGKKIKGIPFLSGKTEIYGDDMAGDYDMAIDYEQYNGIACYTFTQTAKPNKANNVVVDNMKTWFNEKTMEVVARTYSLSYDAFLYDFKVDMEVQMTTVANLTVPRLIRYNGNWKAATKKRERGVFTATLSAFSF